MNTEDWKEYRRTQKSSMRPYRKGEVLSASVSISEADLKAGSPREGDMIARNPANFEDQWLVSKAYFDVNFESV
jgi:hypothetical protein